MSRGLDEFNEAVSETNMIVPTKDVPILGYDKITCRVIKFGKKNEINWKGKDGKPDNTTKHIRLYLHVYSFFEAHKQEFRADLANKTITINPRVAWLPELVALARSLEEESGDSEKFFKHKIQLFRKDKKNPKGEGSFGYIEVFDHGEDSMYSDDDHESVVDVDDKPRESDYVQERVEHVEVPVQKTVEQSQKTAEVPAKKSVIGLLVNCTTVEEAHKLMINEYNEETDTEKKTALLKEYRRNKDRIVAKMVSTAGDPAAYAKSLCEKYYAKEPLKHPELMEIADIAVESREPQSSAAYMEEIDKGFDVDDIPL